MNHIIYFGARSDAVPDVYVAPPPIDYEEAEVLQEDIGCTVLQQFYKV